MCGCEEARMDTWRITSDIDEGTVDLNKQRQHHEVSLRKIIDKFITEKPDISGVQEIEMCEMYHY